MGIELWCVAMGFWSLEAHKWRESNELWLRIQRMI